jgi:hypothetical protein
MTSIATKSAKALEAILIWPRDVLTHQPRTTLPGLRKGYMARVQVTDPKAKPGAGRLWIVVVQDPPRRWALQVDSVLAVRYHKRSGDSHTVRLPNGQRPDVRQAAVDAYRAEFDCNMHKPKETRL